MPNDTGPRYRRSHDGARTHRAGCRYATPSSTVPWHYADGSTNDEMLQALAAHPWLKPCRVCKPGTSS